MYTNGTFKSSPAVFIYFFIPKALISDDAFYLFFRLLGVARDSADVAALIAAGPTTGANGEAPPPPQLYSAPDPEEDPEAQVLFFFG